jgi:hypothetical protein
VKLLVHEPSLYLYDGPQLEVVDLYELVLVKVLLYDELVIDYPAGVHVDVLLWGDKEFH